MKRVLTISFLCAALLFSVAWADVVKEAPAWETQTSDACPNIGPVAPQSSVDAQWDVLWFLNAQTVCQDNQLLGIEFANNMFWITGGNNAVDPNQMYRLTPSGAMIDSVNQPAAATGWGIRDLAYDGTYIYGGCEATTIYAFDAISGAAVPSMNIPRPTGVTVVRALAYDPATDHFWTGNFGSNIVEFDRSGAIIWQGAPPAGCVAIYGMAWDNVDPGGPWLWIHNQSPDGTGVGLGCTFFKYSPVTHALVGTGTTIPLQGGNTGSLAGGACFTSEYNPAFWTMMGLSQGTPLDYFFVLEMYNNTNGYAPAACTGFTAANNGATLTASLAWTLPTFTFNHNPLNPNYPLTSVVVKRNGNVVATLGPAATSYNDNVPSAGLYNYLVYAVNDSGNGPAVPASAWIGLDVPAAPTGVTATVAGLNVNIAWTAPTAGQHGGYWPAGSWIGQKIYRNGTLVTTLLGTNTTYTNTPAVEGDYVYGVVYYNASGDGPAGNAPSVHAGPIAYVASPRTYAWIEINPLLADLPGINTGLAGDDQNLGPFPLGFTYSFYGNSFTTFRACTNGWASFTSTLASYSNTTLPSISAPFDLLACYWDDFNLVNAGGRNQCYYYNDVPNNRTIIEWDSCGLLSGGGNYSVEIIIYASGPIDYMYKSLSAGITSGTVGIQNATGTTGVLCSFNGAGPLLPAINTGIRFAPPSIGGWDVNIAPVSPPITIPANGGSFQYTLNVHNLGTTPGAFYVWNKVINRTYVQTVFGPITRTIGGGANPTRTMTQSIAAVVPSGTCTYRSYVGIVSGVPLDSSSFTFTKSAVADGGPWIMDNNCYGNFLDEFATDVTTPNAYSLSEAYPNPFNPTTTLSFTLANAGVTKLAVFDVTGREVATLVNGFRDAGSHSVTFDASNLASGVYIYRLTAGEFNASGKMVLLK